MKNSVQSWLSTVTIGLWLTCHAFLSFSVASAETKSDDKALPDGLEIIAFGDSLTAGYRLGPKEGFVPQLEAWLAENAGKPIRVHNAGVSGDTSAGGRARLAWSLAAAKGGKPDLVILELGANDMLRAIEPVQTRENLSAIMAALKARGVPVLIAGMMAAPNMGTAYADQFNPIYPDLATTYGADLYPFFLDGVADRPDLNLEDGIHPTAEGIKVIVERIGPKILKSLIENSQ